MPPSNRHSAVGLRSCMVSMTRQPPARRRLVPPTLRDEPRDSACALFRSRRTRDRSDISHSSYERRQRRPDAPWPPWPSTIRCRTRSLALRSVAVARAARATSRSRPPPAGLSTNRRTCHPHADNTPSPPSTRPCRSRALSRSTPRPRTRSASAGTKARGRVRIRRGGGASWLAAALRRYVQARVCRSAPCRPRTAAVVAADGAAGVPGPLRLCVVGAACSLVITAGCISGGCGAWWLAAALLMTRRSAPSVRPFRAGRPPAAAVAAADGPAGVLAPSLRGCVLLARPAACGVTAAPRAVGCVTRTLAECSATSTSRGGVRGGRERRRP